MFTLGKWITQKFTDWLTFKAKPPETAPSLTNYERLCDEIRPGDIILVEGRSRVSNIIKLITQSPWTHSVLFLGNDLQLNIAILASASISKYALTPHKKIVI